MKWQRRAVVAVVAAAAGALLLAVLPSSPTAVSEDEATSRRRPTTTIAPSTTELPPSTAPPAPEPSAEPAPPPTTPVSLPHTLMLIGDSMATTAGLGLAPAAAAWDFEVANEGINGCGVVRGGPFRYFGAQRDAEPRCEAWPAAWQEALTRVQPDVVAVMIGRWELMDRVHDGRWTNLFDPTFAAYVEAEVDGAVTLAASGGARVVVLTTPYYRRGRPPGGGLFPEDDPARVDVINGILRRVAERHQLPVVDVGAFLSPDGTYTRDVAGVRVRSDGVHLTAAAGRLLAPWLFPQLQAVMAAPLPPPPAPPAAPPPPPPDPAPPDPAQ